MLIAILITLIVTAALGLSTRTRERGGLISSHRYNNRYNDAAGAREDHLD
jgi:hypothetical protein